MSDTEKLELMERIKTLKEEIKKLEAMLENDEERQVKIDEITIELSEKEKKLIEALNKEIEKFNKTSAKIDNNLQKIKAKLTLEFSAEEINVTEAINGLTIELKEFEREANALASEIEAFRAEVDNDEFELTPKDIKNRVQTFKDKLLNLKKEQVRRYNIRVELTNMLINEYKEKVSKDSLAYDLVSGMEELSFCNASVTEWRHNSYLSELNYNKLIEISNKFKLIDEKISEYEKTQLAELKVQTDYIDKELTQLEVQLSLDLNDDLLEQYKNKSIEISELLITLGNLLEKCKDNINSSKYEEYKSKHTALMNTYELLQNRLKKLEENIDAEEVADYHYFSSKLLVIETKVKDYEFLVSSLYGNVLSDSLAVFEDRYKFINDEIFDFKTKLDEAYENKMLDENQYINLNNRLNFVFGYLDKINVKLKDPEMYSMKTAEDIYDFLNGTIEGLEKTIEKLENQLALLEKPIKERYVRKEIDAVVKKIESEIKMLEKQLEMYKEKDEEKYNATKERLDNLKKRMSGLGKNYRRKCPLLVRSVKSAKHFFKKYKKQLLIIAGLVAFAMIAHSVIIPAIMHGNIMTACYSPALRGPIKTINNLLGGLIGATKDSRGLWYLANGVRLNAYAATSSLLKGLAISGVGSAALVAPVIVAVKKLIEKINMAELKQKLMEGKERVVEGTKKGATVAKTKLNEGKEKVAVGVKTTKEKASKLVEKSKEKVASSMAKKEIKDSIGKTIKDYAKSGLTVDEYCARNGISGFLVDILESYDMSVLENKENLGKRKGGK